MDSITERSIHQFEKALIALEKGLALKDVPDDVRRDTTLLRFELTAELMPKVLKRILSERGSDVELPRDVVRAATGAGLIDEHIGTVLLSIIRDRNRMVHDYNETYANDLFQRVFSAYAASLRAVFDATVKSTSEN